MMFLARLDAQLSQLAQNDPATQLIADTRTGATPSPFKLRNNLRQVKLLRLPLRRHQHLLHHQCNLLLAHQFRQI